MKVITRGSVHREIVLRQLLIHRKATTTELNDLGVMSVPARIFELKTLGWPIDKIMYEFPDHNGQLHKQAQYFLREEILTPEQQEILNDVVAD